MNSPSLVDVVRRHGRAYLARFGKAVLPSHARALRDIARCRTPALGGHVAECETCGAQHLRYHSCRNRACPQCGAERTASWLARQRELLLPVAYFHVVFTLPSELRYVVRSYQKKLLSVAFRAAFDSLSALCADAKYLGGRIGALAVAHTWTRSLEWHPHIHMLVPGGALTKDGKWVTVSKRKVRFLVPEGALARKFWGRFMHLARKALPEYRFPDLPRKKRWIVRCKETVQGSERVLEYLGRYVNRTALSNHAILACTDQAVTFRYKDSRDYKTKVVTTSPHEFLRRFLQHVPSRGFHRVRQFGLLHARQRPTLLRLQLMLGRGHSCEKDSSGTGRPLRRCPTCHSTALRNGRCLSAEECIAMATQLLALQQRPRGPPPEVTQT